MILQTEVKSKYLRLLKIEALNTKLNRIDDVQIEGEGENQLHLGGIY